MKNKKFLSKVFITAGLALVSSSMLLSMFSGTSIAETFGSVSDPTPIEHETDWFRLNINPQKVSPEGETSFEDYNFTLELSPQPNDYRGARPSDLKQIANEISTGLQDIISSQISFITAHRNVSPRSELVGMNMDNPQIFKYVIDGILREKDYEHEFSYGAPNPAKVEQFNFGYGVADLNTNAGSFLADILAVFAAYGEERAYTNEEIMQRVGVEVNGSGQIVAVSNSNPYSIMNSLIPIYLELGDLNAENNAKLAVLNIYRRAISLPKDKNMTPEQFVVLIGGYDETYIELQSLIDIFGRHTLTEKAKEVFGNSSVGVQYPQYLLNYCSEMILSDLFDRIQKSYQDNGEAGIDDEFVIGAMDFAGPERIFDICSNLTSQGLLNLAIFMGKGIDFSRGYWIIENESGSISHTGTRADSSDYASVGSEMLTNFMNNLTAKAALTGIQQVIVGYKDQDYMLLEKPVNEFGKISNTLEIRTRNLINLLNALPKMRELRYRSNADMYEDFTIKLITSINDREPILDEEGYPIAFNDPKPVELHARVGFMPEKDCKYIRKLAAVLDDTFDLEFGYDDQQDLWVDLETRTPNFVSNIYAWLCDSGFIKNDSDIKFLNEIWDHAFSTLGEIKEWIQSKNAEILVEDLKNIDYEVALATITSADDLNEILNTSRITDSMIDKAMDKGLEYFKRLVDKGMTYTFDDIVEFVARLNEGAAEKLDNAKLEKLYAKVQSLLEKIHNKNVDVDMLLSIQNETIYGYVERLTGKANWILRARNLALKALNRLPERAMDFSLMDLYAGNGEFKGSGSANIRYDKISSLAGRVQKVSNLWAAFDGMFVGDDRPATVSWNIDVTFADVYSITYEWTEDGVEKSKSGILHEGSDVMLFGGLEEDDGGSIVHWLDKNQTFNRVDEMVSYDVTVIPEYLFSVDVSDIEKTYDGQVSYLTAIPSGDYISYYDFSYQWEKFNDESNDFEPISGATNSTYGVKNHSDSGKYRVVVNNGKGETVTKEASVDISKAQVELLDEWIYSGAIAYDGEAHTVAYDLTKVPDGASFKEYTGTVTATDEGSYTAYAVFELSDTDNYEFKDGVDTVSKVWEIKDMEIHIAPVFEELNEFEYDGESTFNSIIDETSYDHDLVKLVGYETKEVGEPDTAYVSGGRTEVGEYVVRPIFEPLDSDYSIDTTNIPTKEFYIYKTVDLSQLSWSYHNTFTYNGSEHSVYVKNCELIPEIDHIEYVTKYYVDGQENEVSSNIRVDANTAYKTIATPVLAEGFSEHTIKFVSDNVFGNENARSWSISQAVIEVKQVTWDYCYDENGHSPFVYEKNTTYSVDLVEGFLPEQLGYRFVEGSEHSAENAGSYTARIEIFIKPEYADNYVLSDTSIKEYQCNWTISPQVLYLDNIVWSDETAPLVYNGETLTTTVMSFDNSDLIRVVEEEYRNNENVNAGSYSAVAFFELTDTSGNYVLDEEIVVHDYVISKAEISVSDIQWNYNSANPYVEDGTAKEVYIESFTNSEIVEVTYINNSEFTNNETTAGEYEAKAVFTIKDEYKNNYVLVGDDTAYVYWKISEAEVNNYNFFTSVEVDNENNPLATVLVGTEIHENPTLKANASDGAMFEGLDINYEEIIGGKGEINYSYDLTFEYENEIYEFGENTFTTNVLIPEEIRGEEFAIVTITDDGSVSEVEYTIKGNYAEICGDFVGKIGFVTKTPHSKALADNPQNLVIILLAAVGQLVFALTTILVAKKIKKHRKQNN